MENSNILKTAIDMYINGRRFFGSVLYNKDTEEFDFSNLKVTKGEIVVDYDSVRVLTVRYYDDFLNGYSIEDVIKNEVLYRNELNEDLVRCDTTGFVFHTDSVEHLYNGDSCINELVKYFDYTDEYYLKSDFGYYRVRDEDGEIHEWYAPSSWIDNRYYCDECECYIVNDDDYNCERHRCLWCSERVIEGYTESHRHNDNPVYFGEHKGEFAGFGFELEVDSDDCDMQGECNETASHLIGECGFEDEELRYAHDGSLRYGFEIISEPHTVEDFWSKTKKWEAMLSYLVQKGWRSHDAGTCGLHIHVSRTLLGKTEIEQDRAIAKIYTFFDDNWRDIVRVSRRTSFDYCDKNLLDYTDARAVECGRKTKYNAWKKKIKNCGSHYVALNNRNRNTFEFRLGRGTLNAWSFFSWIDFILTIAKNARRITVEKVTSNDLTSWLAGITESTARYIYKRGAFKSTVLALYPSIKWSADNSDSSDD